MYLEDSLTKSSNARICPITYPTSTKEFREIKANSQLSTNIL